MLLKFETIEEIGRFATLKQKAPHFTDLTLIFARNGYGKSTICSILRSATEGDPKHIQARRRIGAKKDSLVHSKWASGADATFASNKWSRCPGKIYVFDQEFVLQNLHVGDNVTRENMRSLLPIVLGEDGVKLATKITALDQEQRELDAKLRAASGIIRAVCPAIDTPAALAMFCSAEIPSDIEQKIERAGRAVELARLATVVQQKKNLKRVSAPELITLTEVAKRTIDSVSVDASERVQQQIKKHHLDTGDRWLKYGVDHVGETCPFCDQNIEHVDLITSYQAYFSEAFGSLVAERDAAIEHLQRLRSDSGEGLHHSVSQNDTDLAFWNTVSDLPVQPSLTESERAAVVAGIDLVIAAFQAKVANPLLVVTLPAASPEVQRAFSLIEEYNRQVEQCNAAVDAARAETGAADVTRAQTIWEKWKALKARQGDPLRSAAADYGAATTRRQQIEKEKETAQTALRTYATKTVGARQTEINELLALFGANFTIVDTKANFVGREPNTEYAIAVPGGKIKAGDQSTTTPSFKTVLSAGDKTTLALAFFITQVRSEPQLANTIVVFDDPFSSQDMQRQFETTSQIRAIAEPACQTLVLSHDPRFLQMIERDAPNGITSTFQIICADTGDGAITQWSSDEELKSQYVRQAEMIREYVGQGTPLKGTTENELVQALRPFLEDYLRARYPGRFANNAMLTEMAQAIEDEGPSDLLFPSVADLRTINEFTRPNHHGGGQRPDPTALRAQCGRVIKVIGSY